jgi:hypothetical protein
VTVSTPSLVDQRVHAVAVKAALNTALTGDAAAYDYDEVPGSNGNAGTLPNIYVALSVERRAGAPLRSTASTGRTGWRVAARCVGRSVNECRWAVNKVAVALNEKALTIGGDVTTPVQFESDQAPELDDGRYSALALYTYVH